MKSLELVERVELLKAMETVLKAMNDERATYQWEHDIFTCGVEDLTYTAENNEFMNDACEIFLDSIRCFHGGGFYLGSEVFAFTKEDE